MFQFCEIIHIINPFKVFGVRTREVRLCLWCGGASLRLLKTVIRGTVVVFQVVEKICGVAKWSKHRAFCNTVRFFSPPRQLLQNFAVFFLLISVSAELLRGRCFYRGYDPSQTMITCRHDVDTRAECVNPGDSRVQWLSRRVCVRCARSLARSPWQQHRESTEQQSGSTGCFPYSQIFSRWKQDSKRMCAVLKSYPKPKNLLASVCSTKPSLFSSVRR